MLPRQKMLTIKNQSCIRWHGGHANKKIRIGQNSILLVLTMAMVAGCSPNGPRALIQGKRLIEEGKYAQAVEKLQTATSLMATNSHAWNYLGLAYHYSKQPAPAEKAYQRALSLNSDLPEASYNLGCLWLEQNRVEAAKSQFVTYTLRRGSAPEGFLKLGTAQLRAAAALTSIPQRSSSLLTAEKTFEDALRLSPQNAEAINNLGVARYERGRTSEGVQYFRQALQIHPKYRPALLNLAVSSQLSKDSRGAIEYYKQFLASSPPLDSQSQVKSLIRDLEKELNPPARQPGTNAMLQVASNTPQTHISNPVSEPAKQAATLKTQAVPALKPATNGLRVAQSTNIRPPQVVALAPPPPSNKVTTNASAPLPRTNLDVVNVQAAPTFKVAEDVSLPPPPLRNESPAGPVTSENRVSSTPSDKGLLQRLNPMNLFQHNAKTTIRPTPLPTPTASDNPAPQVINGYEGASYNYHTIGKLSGGDRKEAQRVFSEGTQAQGSHELPRAVEAYRKATQLDPSYFEAYYNLGLAAGEIGDVDGALLAYEKRWQYSRNP